MFDRYVGEIEPFMLGPSSSLSGDAVAQLIASRPEDKEVNLSSFVEESSVQDAARRSDAAQGWDESGECGRHHGLQNARDRVSGQCSETGVESWKERTRRILARSYVQSAHERGMDNA